ncbi:hypothetical protein ACIQLG_03870 [Terribacillus saccharophilus]|uniref:hypothetical protein n=1 Tax=Terribacillus saccharophilus TaxID=361277 RepID=UPI0038285961
MVEDLKTTIKNDEDILANLDIFKEKVSNDEFLNEVIYLCREVYLAQYNGETATDDGKLSVFIPDETMNDLATKFIDIISKYASIDTEKAFSELSFIIAKYYIMTATKEEYESRSGVLKASTGQQIGLFGTLYNRNLIEWESFESYLRSKINIS